MTNSRWWSQTPAALSRIAQDVLESGTCTTSGEPDAWFPVDERPHSPATPAAREASLQRAAEMCEGCPVLADCRKAALNRPDREGIFGGLPGWALEEIRRTRPLERVANRENYESMVILGERARYELLGTGITRAERDEMHERTLRLIDLVANAGDVEDAA